jgi:D-sedoheptulose 7-phosphate isomerase
MKHIIKIVDILLNGNLILTGGNGGSFSDCEHFVAELTGRFSGIIEPYPAMNMGSNGAELTAFANDFGYDKIYLPYIKAFQKFNPSFLFVTTSGKSKNILDGIKYIISNYKNINIVLLNGANECLIKHKNIYEYNSSSLNTQEIQEDQIVVLHKIAETIKIRLSK